MSVESKSSSRYHHGNLRQALLQTTLELAAETGLEQVSLREVARRLGVSPGAPFRHFKDRRELMTAIAEEATRQLRIMVERDQLVVTGDAIAGLRALGRSFLNWAWLNPTQFRLVSSRHLFDFSASESLKQNFGLVRDTTLALIRQAQSEQALPAHISPEKLGLSLRASAYGLARMVTDGQLPQWGVNSDEEAQAAISCLDLILDSMCIRGYPA